MRETPRARASLVCGRLPTRPFLARAPAAPLRGTCAQGQTHLNARLVRETARSNKSLTQKPLSGSDGRHASVSGRRRCCSLFLARPVRAVRPYSDGDVGHRARTRGPQHTCPAPRGDSLGERGTPRARSPLCPLNWRRCCARYFDDGEAWYLRASRGDGEARRPRVACGDDGA